LKKFSVAIGKIKTEDVKTAIQDDSSNDIVE